MKKTKWSVYIGRFQPIHNGHLQVVKKALDHTDNLLILIGSSMRAGTSKNPFYGFEVSSFIRASLSSEENSRVTIDHLSDYKYDDYTWATQVRKVVRENTGDSTSISLIGYNKDVSSYYLKMFPEWSSIDVKANNPEISSTKIRELIYKNRIDQIKDLVPENVYETIFDTPFKNLFKDGREEYNFTEAYKSSWSGSPFPPIFVTTDAVVIKDRHVLLIKRKFNPGKGLLALPGGFINQNENIFNCCLRELEEETNLMVSNEELKESLRDVHVFDSPDRDRRGRTITHAHFFVLDKHKPLPRIKAADDAEDVMWYPIREMNEMDFYSDHIDIIEHFLYKNL